MREVDLNFPALNIEEFQIFIFKLEFEDVKHLLKRNNPVLLLLFKFKLKESKLSNCCFKEAAGNICQDNLQLLSPL